MGWFFGRLIFFAQASRSWVLTTVYQEISSRTDSCHTQTLFNYCSATGLLKLFFNQSPPPPHQGSNPQFRCCEKVKRPPILGFAQKCFVGGLWLAQPVFARGEPVDSLSLSTAVQVHHFGLATTTETKAVLTASSRPQQKSNLPICHNLAISSGSVHCLGIFFSAADLAAQQAPQQTQRHNKDLAALLTCPIGVGKDKKFGMASANTPQVCCW